MQQGPESQVKSSSAVLDVRGIAAPDNVVAILKKASELPNGSTLEFVIESNPFQLYDLLQQRGYVLEMQPQKDGTFAGKAKAREKDAAGH